MSVQNFLHDRYQRHNKRRQEHLATLGLPLADRSVLELGAGIGDHTSFFLDRNCRVTVTDARDEHIEYIRARYPEVAARVLDLEVGLPADLGVYEVVYAYGFLYHVGDPSTVIKRAASLTGELMLLETCVSFGSHEAINQVNEDLKDSTQAAHGIGCRPTRPWVYRELKRSFPHVYLTRTQPWHEEFPLDWRQTPPVNPTGLHRSVFVASRRPLANDLLSERLLDVQTRA